MPGRAPFAWVSRFMGGAWDDLRGFGFGPAVEQVEGQHDRRKVVVCDRVGSVPALLARDLQFDAMSMLAEKVSSERRGDARRLAIRVGFTD